jgi:hypothetical protein
LSVGDENPLRRERGWRHFELRSRFGSAPKLKLAELRFGFVINLPLHELYKRVSLQPGQLITRLK